MNELKKIYLKVKAKSNNFKSPLGETYTGDELYFLTMELQSWFSSNFGSDLGDDQTLFNKLFYYVEPMPK